jgi:hypothetical protein
VLAGEQKTLSLALSPANSGHANAYMYMHSLGYSNPTVYLREMPGVTIDKSSIEVKKNGGNVPFSVTEYTTSMGVNVIAIQVFTEIGFYFDGKVEGGAVVTFDVFASIDTVAAYPLTNYFFMDANNASDYGNNSCAVGCSVADIYDLNNN